MALSDMTYKYMDDGVIVNDRSSVIPFIDLDRITGLDTPDARVITRDRDGAEGSFVYSRFSKHRTVVLDMTVYAESATLDAELTRLKGNYRQTTDEFPFYFKHSGSSEKVIFAKGTGLKYTMDPTWSLGIQSCTAVLLAADPRIYSAAETVATSKFEAFIVSGRNYPKSYAYVYGATSTDSEVRLFNEGNVDTGFYMFIYGPVNNPRIEHLETGRFIQLNTNIASGEVLSVNLFTAQIWLGTERDIDGTAPGSVDTTSAMSLDSRWLYALPGTNTYKCVGANVETEVSKVEIVFRSAWL